MNMPRHIYDYGGSICHSPGGGQTPARLGAFVLGGGVQNSVFFYLSPLFPLSTFVERGIGGEVSKNVTFIDSLRLSLLPRILSTKLKNIRN